MNAFVSILSGRFRKEEDKAGLCRPGERRVEFAAVQCRAARDDFPSRGRRRRSPQAWDENALNIGIDRFERYRSGKLVPDREELSNIVQEMSAQGAPDQLIEVCF